jgi:xanthine dehydrogenase molybdenum-binding subunit
MADLAGTNGTRKDFRVVGKPNLPGVLSWAQATGVAKFGIDYVVPDMLHAKFLRSPYANARIKKIDTTKAKAIPGVIDVITWEDEDIKKLSSGGDGGFLMGPTQPFLDNQADHEGIEVGAIVVAESEDLCEEALRALVIEWDEQACIVDLRKGRAQDAPIIRSAAPASKGGGSRMGSGSNNNPPKQGNVSYSNTNDGDTEKGFKEADHIIEYDMNTAAFSGHIPNPLGTVAWWFDNPTHGEGKNLQIEGVPWGHDQVASTNRVSPEKVFQECMFVGGRYCDWGIRKSQQITPVLAKRTGRPVRCVNRRTDMYDFNLCQRYVHMKIGFKSNGLITAIHDFSIADGGVRGSSVFGNTMDQTYGPYFTTRCKNVKQNMEVVDSNTGMMYVSGQHNPMGWDTLMVGLYLIAEKLQKDPIEIATLNLHGPTSQDDTTPVPSYEACVTALKKMMNWNWHQAGAKKLPDGRMHGASFRYNQCPRHSGGTYNPKLELRNGIVRLSSKGPIIGHYGLEANAMTVAEELGLEYKDIRIDLDHHEIYRPFGGGSDGSTASSWAMKECANKLKKLILETAVEEANKPAATGGIMMGAPGPKQAPNPFKGLKSEDLDMQNGKVIVKNDPSKGLPLAQAVRANLFATYSGRPPLALWNQRGKELDTMNVATCEVAVDEETGEVEILRFGVVTDTGKIMRQTSLEGQIHQVLDFTKGCQLQEEFIYDPKTGVRLSTNMFEYKKVSMLDMPRVDLELLETRAGNACYGSNGISHSLANTHLIIMAIHNAIGKWVESPATPEKVLKALGKG